MKPTFIIAVLLLSGCVEEEPVAVAEAPTPAPTNEIDTAKEVVEALALEPEPAPPPPPKKKKRKLNYSRCLDIRKAFISCGWKCTRQGYDIEQCVTACNHFLTRRGQKCLYMFGPGFG